MRCSTCKNTGEGFYPFTAKKGGKIYYRCRPCNTEAVNKYRTSEKGKAAIRRAVKKYEAKNKKRRPAWNKVKKMPLKPCEVCGSEEWVHRHHPNIDKPLEVEFLCPLHHKERHKEML